MSKEITLAATSRTVTGRHVHALRREGQVPAVLYGHNVESQCLSTDLRELQRVWLKAGRSHLVDVTVDGGGARKVVIRAIQRNPRTNLPIHVDLYAVNLKEKLTAEVAIVLVGEAPAVSETKVGQLLQTLTHVRVSCLPQDLPAQISVDVSGLTEVDQAITLSQLEVPRGVELLHGEADETVVKIAAMRVQAADAEADVAEASASAAASADATAEAEAAPEG